MFNIVAAINYDSLHLMLEFTVIMLGLFLLVLTIAYITPLLAKKVDKIRANRKKEVKKGGMYDINVDDGLPAPYSKKSNIAEKPADTAEELNEETGITEEK